MIANRVLGLDDTLHKANQESWVESTKTPKKLAILEFESTSRIDHFLSQSEF